MSWIHSFLVGNGKVLDLQRRCVRMKQTLYRPVIQGLLSGYTTACDD